MRPGDRVELVSTNDPFTRLRPGVRGTVRSIWDRDELRVNVDWDDGSTLSMLPESGDQVRVVGRER